MSKRILSLLGAALLLAFAAYASDVWKDKDFKEWDQKDVQKIMTDSPWVKKIESGSGGGGGSNPSPAFTEISPSAKGVDTGSMGSSGGTAARSGGRGSDVSGGGGDRGGGGPLGGNYTVQWASSRTIREATARGKELNGASADDARKGLASAPEGYIIIVRGNNLGAFSHASQDDLVQNSYLELKGTKVKINAAKVVAQGPEGGRVFAVIFDFPKKTATGEPTIPPDEKGANFVTKVGKVELKVTFDFTKMVDKQGADL